MLDPRQRAELVQGIYAAAREVGARPQDVASVIGYETGGTFDPWKAGPTTKWGQHRGLIQWGEPQARQYGVSANTPVVVQMQAVAKYLRDHGFRPGMGLLDLYSTVNAGRPGLYSASDRPGATVASHTQNITSQFGDALARLQGGAVLPPPKSTSIPALFAGGGQTDEGFDPLISALQPNEGAPVVAAGPDPRDERRRALLEMIGAFSEPPSS